jgi:hypothetical protein
VTVPPASTLAVPDLVTARSDVGTTVVEPLSLLTALDSGVVVVMFAVTGMTAPAAGAVYEKASVADSPGSNSIGMPDSVITQVAAL